MHCLICNVRSITYDDSVNEVEQVKVLRARNEVSKYGDRLDLHVLVHIWALEHSSKVLFRYFKLNFIDHPSVLHKVILCKR